MKLPEAGEGRGGGQGVGKRPQPEEAEKREIEKRRIKRKEAASTPIVGGGAVKAVRGVFDRRGAVPDSRRSVSF